MAPSLMDPVLPSPHTANHTAEDNVTAGEVELVVPDMFTSIMSVEIVQNPHYVEVKKEADAWVAEILGYSEKQAARNSRADFAYMVSWWVGPHCDADTLRTLIDWNHWFDEGHLKDDIYGAAREIIHMMSLLDNGHPGITREEDPLGYIFQHVYRKLQKYRYRKCKSLYIRVQILLLTCPPTDVEQYMLGVLAQFNSRKMDLETITVEEFMVFRRATVAAMPCMALVEYALGIEVPEDVINHPSLKACQEVSVDLKPGLTLLSHNDILSYKKDVLSGEDLSIINILRSQGWTLQDAVDETGRMLDGCYQRWYEALLKMPSWGSTIDRIVYIYLEGIRNIALGCLLWSFWTERYFNREEGRLVRETRKLRLPIPSPLSSTSAAKV
ncbi:isoprenoid synthase domain-containing protein [Apiospora rasikravindrae]|uniref:Terpene synthase n=1 Tax=Apiospora rasikravindrae TaxID=990691 RepID=A0ABR1RSS6_9PEZI